MASMINHFCEKEERKAKKFLPQISNLKKKLIMKGGVVNKGISESLGEKEGCLSHFYDVSDILRERK